MCAIQRFHLCLLAGLIAAVGSSRAIAQESGEPGEARETEVRQVQPAAPALAPSPKQVRDDDLQRVEHLRLAAEHLKAAGLHHLAGRLDRELLIETKLDQIRRLQAEVDALRAGTSSPQVLLRLKIVELQTAELRKKGFDVPVTPVTPLACFSEKDELGHGVMHAVVLKAGEADQLMEALRKEKLAKVLAEPTLVALSGRPASLQSGGEIPIIVPQSLGARSIEYRQTGTRVDTVATVLENGRVRLELRASVSDIDAAQGIQFQDISVPGLRTRNVDTAIELDSGQTAVLCGMERAGATCDEDSAQCAAKSLLIAVTVDVVQADVVTAQREQPTR